MYMNFGLKFRTFLLRLIEFCIEEFEQNLITSSVNDTLFNLYYHILYYLTHIIIYHTI